MHMWYGLLCGPTIRLDDIQAFRFQRQIDQSRYVKRPGTQVSSFRLGQVRVARNMPDWHDHRVAERCWFGRKERDVLVSSKNLACCRVLPANYRAERAVRFGRIHESPSWTDWLEYRYRGRRLCAPRA